MARVEVFERARACTEAMEQIMQTRNEIPDRIDSFLSLHMFYLEADTLRVQRICMQMV